MVAFFIAFFLFFSYNNSVIFLLLFFVFSLICDCILNPHSRGVLKKECVASMWGFFIYRE